MISVFGQNLSKEDLLKRIGDMSQIVGAAPISYTDGRAKGTAAIEIKNGSGLRFVVMTDRGMDISYAEINGTPFSFISKTGVVGPQHYDETDFLRSFTGGLLTTCGLTYMGAACVDEGKQLGLHGRISNIPAYDVSVNQDWQGEDYVVSVSGKVRESAMFGENIVLKRTITTKLGDNRIYISDEVVNEGFEETPLMILYHMNFGYPLVSEHTVLETNCTDKSPRNDIAEKGMETSDEFCAPVHGYVEQCFYRNAVEKSFASLINKETGLSAKIEFYGAQLPYLIQWKQMGEKDYVVGLEPGTWYPEGRAKARETSNLQFIKPQETKRFDIVVSSEKQ